MGSRRKCTACGNVGHIKTNPKCPKKQEPLDGNPPQPPQPSKEQLGVLMARAAESDEHIEIPKKLERVWELSKKLVEASRGVSPSPVRGARVRDLHPSQFPSPGSSPAGPSLQPASPSPQTPGSTFVAHVADRPELLKAFYSEIVDLLKLDAAVGHSSMTLDYLASKCGSQVAGLAELIMGALTPFSGLLGKRSYSITAQVRSAIAAKCQDNANLQVELLTLPDDVAKHLLRAIHPKFLYIEQLSHIDLRSEHQLYGGVSMLLYAVLSYSKGLPVLNLEALSTPSEEAGTLPGQESSRFERALQLLRHLLWEHELWVAGKASRGPIEYVALRREPGPVCFKAATEIKTTEGQLIAAIPQVVSEGIALIESNERQTAYEKDEPRSVSVLLTTLKIWLKFGFTMLESSTPGNLQLAITIAGPFEYYDIGAELLSDEAEDVVKLIVQTLLPGMIGIPLEEWKKLGEAFSASLDQLAREQLDDRDPGSKRRRASLEKELEETKKLLAEKEKLIQDMAKEAAMKAKAEQGVLEAQARQRRSRK